MFSRLCANIYLNSNNHNELNIRRPDILASELQQGCMLTNKAHCVSVTTSLVDLCCVHRTKLIYVGVISSVGVCFCRCVGRSVARCRHRRRRWRPDACLCVNVHAKVIVALENN